MVNLSNVNVVTWNVNGIRKESKRRGIFNYLKTSQAHIILLQETHSVVEDEKVWSNEWGSKIYFSHGSNFARGVAILFQKHFPCSIEYVTTDLQGRFIVLDMAIAEIKFILTNSYAPNEDNPQFYVQMFEVIEKRENDSLMLGGDFNTTLDPDLDLYNNSGINHHKKREILREFLELKNMVDIWRNHNPECKMFTWRKPESRELVMSRLDYIFLSQDLALRVNKVEIKAKVISDHSRVQANMDFAPSKRGRGFWKFNNLLLQDKDFLDRMNELILKERFAVKNASEIDLEHQWESLKRKITSMAKETSWDKAKQRKALIENFERRILNLDKKIEQAPNKETLDKYRYDLHKTEQFLLDEYELRVQAACFRSKAEYYLRGEKSSKYFFNLEKARGNSKVLSKIVREDGSIVKEAKAILKEQRIFYRKLYGNRAEINWPYVNETQIKLDDKERELFEQEITDIEISNSLMGMANSKTPGTDGLTADFYKVFWIHLRDLYGRLVREIMLTGRMHESAKKGIITLLPKKDKDLNFLKNWRPLTLLNVDYKIISRALALRLKTKIGALIHEDQTGFIEGRNIAHSLRTILDVVQVANDRSLDMILVSLDWEKCFDKISFLAIDQALNYFNFGPKFRGMIQTLIQDTNSCVLHNGHISEYFTNFSGTKQGSNISPLLFIFLAEILAIQIRNNTNIKGIVLGDVHHKLTQFADDLNVFLKFERLCLMELENTLDTFQLASMLVVNYDKTSLYRIGSLANSNAKFVTRKPFVWSNGPIKILGIELDLDTHVMQQNNVDQLLAKVQRRCEQWQFRGLTLMGKTLIINALCASLYIYRLAVLRSLNKTQLSEFNATIKKFLWSGRAKISLDKLSNSKEFGGLKLINLYAKDVALKCQWVSTYRQFLTIKNLADVFLPEIGEDIWICNLRRQDVASIMGDNFWKDVLESWSINQFLEPRNISQIAAQMIWYNSFIKIQGKPIFFKEAHQLGIKFIHNIWNQPAASFLTYPQLQQIYGSNCLSYLQYYGIISAIPRSWINELKNTRFILEDFVFPFESWDGKTTSKTYDKIVSDKKLLTKLRDKWSEKLNVSIDYDLFLSNFEQIYKLTTSTKLRNFQYRFLHRTIFCANTLYKWHLVRTPICFYCETELETLEHLFFHCTETKKFMQTFQSWYEAVTNTEIQLHIEELFFCSHENDLLNTLYLMLKQYIFSSKCTERVLNIHIFKEKLMEIIRIERYDAFKTKKFKPFIKKWQNLF